MSDYVTRESLRSSAFRSTEHTLQSGKKVRLKELSAAFMSEIIDREQSLEDTKQGVNVSIEIVSRSICDENGKVIFQYDDPADRELLLEAFSLRVLGEMAQKIMAFSSPETEEEIKKNLTEPSVETPSDLLATWDVKTSIPS